MLTTPQHDLLIAVDHSILNPAGQTCLLLPKPIAAMLWHNDKIYVLQQDGVLVVLEDRQILKIKAQLDYNLTRIQSFDRKTLLGLTKNNQLVSISSEKPFHIGDTFSLEEPINCYLSSGRSILVGKRSNQIELL